MIISREIESKIKNSLKPNKVLIIFGARRTGKTFLLKQLIKYLDESYLLLNGDDIATHEILERRSISNYQNLLGNTKILIIDEAQKINEIGEKLKLMIDGIHDLKIIVTGSSAFDLHHNLGEPLTGRKHSFHLYPFSEHELSQMMSPIEKSEDLKERLVFGSYPELTFLKSRSEKQEYLRELVNSYLLKDILSFENIRSSSKITELLRLIAYQVGNEVSINELAVKLSINKGTVEKYLDLLTKVFILHRLGAYSGNLRKEVAKSTKWYFFDNGIRNAIISNFSQINVRDDVGKLWENYIISERLKHQSNASKYANNFFWRTYDKQEIDWIEERDGKLFPVEFKWNAESIKVPGGWKKNYPDFDVTLINQYNYISWINEEK